MIARDIQLRAQRHIILTQMAGGPVVVLLTGGFFMTYLTLLGLENTRMLDLLAVVSLLQILLQPVVGDFGDRHGRGRVALAGALLKFPGLLLLGLLPLVPPALFAPLLWGGVLLLALGRALFVGNWFGLLTPMIAAGERGRFLAKLRISWQLCAVLLVAALSRLLDHYPGPVTYQAVFAFSLLLACFHYYHLRRIPDPADYTKAPTVPFHRKLLELLEDPRLRGFCSYVFLLSAASGAILFVNVLLMQEHLGFSRGRVVFVGNFAGAGALLGFFAGGHAVDRLGTKAVFVSVHLAFALIFLLTPLHALSAVPAYPFLCLIHFAYGFFNAASGIASSSIIFELAHAHHYRSLMSSLGQTCVTLGPPVALFAVSRLLASGMFRPDWQWRGLELSAYDSLNLLCGGLVLLLVVTLGLVPYNLRHAEAAPKEG